MCEISWLVVQHSARRGHRSTKDSTSSNVLVGIPGCRNTAVPNWCTLARCFKLPKMARASKEWKIQLSGERKKMCEHRMGLCQFLTMAVGAQPDPPTHWTDPHTNIGVTQGKCGQNTPPPLPSDQYSKQAPQLLMGIFNSATMCMHMAPGNWYWRAHKTVSIAPNISIPGGGQV